jgi:hypothetical protein
MSARRIIERRRRHRDVDEVTMELAHAAVLATERGPARAVEASKWARRIVASKHPWASLVYMPGQCDRDEWIDAHVQLQLALNRELSRAA